MSHPELSFDPKIVAKYSAVGSRVTSTVFREESDFDYLVLTRGPAPDYFQRLGYALESASSHYEPDSGQFNSWRKGNINLIVTQSTGFYRKFTEATKVTKNLDLRERKDRVTLFQYILYGKT